MNPKKSFFLIYFLMLVSGLGAQKLPAIRSTLDKQKILIGEPAELVVETEGRSPVYFHIDTIPHFEFLSLPKIDTIDNGNNIVVRGVYKITSFDSGQWSIPAFKLSSSARSDTIPIEVVFSEFDPKQDYHDIKDIIETSEAKKKIKWWWFAAGAVLSGALLFYLLRKKKPVLKQATRQPIRGAYEEAMKKLELLEKNKPVSKIYYSSLTEIFRVYIFKTQGVHSMQKTTDDLVIQLTGLGLEKQQFDELSQVLRLSDFVKFAQYGPNADDDSFAMKTIRESISQIEKAGTKNKITDKV